MTKEVIEIMTKHLKPLLNSVGDLAQCSGCGADIYWIKHKNGKKAPYTPWGLNHFADCPKAKSFKRKEF